MPLEALRPALVKTVHGRAGSWREPGMSAIFRVAEAVPELVTPNHLLHQAASRLHEAHGLEHCLSRTETADPQQAELGELTH
jgi:hypothetical protein